MKRPAGWTWPSPCTSATAAHGSTISTATRSGSGPPSTASGSPPWEASPTCSSARCRSCSRSCAGVSSRPAPSGCPGSFTKSGTGSGPWAGSGRTTPWTEFRMFVTCENTDDLPYIVQETGEDGLVIGTDYGHTDTSSDVDAIKVFRKRDGPVRGRQAEDPERQRAPAVRAVAPRPNVRGRGSIQGGLVQWAQTLRGSTRQCRGGFQTAPGPRFGPGSVQGARQ